MSDALKEKPEDDKDDLVEIEVEAEEEAEGKPVAEGAPAEAAAGGDEPKAAEPAAENGEDDDEDDDDEDEGDERLSAEQRSEKLNRRQRAKLRRKEARERQQRELAELRSEAARARLESQKTKVEVAVWRAQQESAQIDQQAATLQAEYRRWQNAKADAINKNDGQRATQADYQLTQIQQRYSQLNDAKLRASQVLQGLGEEVRKLEAYEAKIAEAFAAAEQPGSVEPQTPQLGPDGQRMAKEFMALIPWYKPGVRAGDSALVDTIDALVARDGYDPNSKEYWDEFRTRLKAAMPHKFAQPKNPAPPVGAGRETLAANKTKMRIPKEALETMRLAGIIDETNAVTDRKKFDSYLARFKKNQQSQQRRAS